MSQFSSFWKGLWLFLFFIFTSVAVFDSPGVFQVDAARAGACAGGVREDQAQDGGKNWGRYTAGWAEPSRARVALPRRPLVPRCCGDRSGFAPEMPARGDIGAAGGFYGTHGHKRLLRTEPNAVINCTHLLLMQRFFNILLIKCTIREGNGLTSCPAEAESSD